jgi:hypothetical protein
LLIFLRRWEEAREVGHRLGELAGEDSQSMQTAVQDLVFSGDGAGAAELARRGLAMHPNNALMAYQAHRALLWNGNIDEARALMPSIESSQITWFNKDLARLRQACAEGNLQEARRIHERFVAEFGEGQAVLWISYQLLGMPDEANAVLIANDKLNQLFSLANFLGYPYFDPRPFPNLMQWAKQEGVGMQSPVEIPYRCPTPAADGNSRVRSLTPDITSS